MGRAACGGVRDFGGKGDQTLDQLALGRVQRSVGEALVRRYRLTFPEVRDGDGGFAGAYGTNQLPETFVIDRSGRVVAISRGEVNRSFLQRANALAASS